MKSDKSKDIIIISDCLTGDIVDVVREERLNTSTLDSIISDHWSYDYLNGKHGINIKYGIE